MPLSPQDSDEEPDDLTRKVVINAYAHFCARENARPNALSARRFAVEVTESGAKQYHGLDAKLLERVLMKQFAGAATRTPDTDA